MTRIAIVCNDTRGGVQPYVALALGLRAAGHEVRAVAPADLTALFTDRGIPVAPLGGSVQAVLREAGGTAEAGLVASMRLSAKHLPTLIDRWTRETLEGCDRAELITGGVGGMVVGLSVAEKLGVPFVESHLQPIGMPTDAYPAVLAPHVPGWLGGWARRWSHRLSDAILWSPFRPVMARARRRVLGLTGPARTPAGQPALYAFSREVVPIPSTPARGCVATGYWTSPAPAAWSPPEPLVTFLARPGPVVSIGFGSMTSADAQALGAVLREAVRKAEVRAVLLTGWGAIPALQDDALYALDEIPHSWLFPRMDAVVHHGGAGTTGAALSAGVPSLVVPFTMDQPFWGSRVAALGVGPDPIPRRRLTADRLAAALRLAVDDGPMRARAAALGERLRAEDGVGAAVELLGRIRPLAAPG